MNLQGDVDLMVAYANKIALGLSMKEHAINERMIEQEGRTAYSLNMPHSKQSLRKYTGFGCEYNSKEESSLCNSALLLVESGMGLIDLIGKRTKVLIECAFSRNLTLMKEDESSPEIEVGLPFESLRGLDYQLRWNKQKIRKFIISNYRKTPHEIRELMKAISLPMKAVKQWIQYSRRSEKITSVREEVIKQSLKSRISFTDFKRIARKIFRTRLFHASDRWCLDFIKKYQLENMVELPKSLISK